MRIGSRVKDRRDGNYGTVVAIEDDTDDDGTPIFGTVVVALDRGRRVEYKHRDDDAPRDLLDLDDVTPLLFVNIYLHNRAYGGPEEGGWWYDTYEPVHDECRRYDSPIDAEGMYNRRLKWCREVNEGRRPVHSVLSDGVFVPRLEAYPAEYSPAVRPHYC